MNVTAVLREAASSQTFDFDNNPYKAKRRWPPDFDKLSQKHQFRLERRYKRRSKLKWARPRLMAATKLVQWGAGIGVLVYGLLYMDQDKANPPFQELRAWYRETTDSIFKTRRPPPRTTQGQQDNPA